LPSALFSGRSLVPHVVCDVVWFDISMSDVVLSRVL